MSSQDRTVLLCIYALVCSNVLVSSLPVDPETAENEAAILHSEKTKEDTDKSASSVSSDVAGMCDDLL